MSFINPLDQLPVLLILVACNAGAWVGEYYRFWRPQVSPINTAALIAQATAAADARHATELALTRREAAAQVVPETKGAVSVNTYRTAAGSWVQVDLRPADLHLLIDCPNCGPTCIPLIRDYPPEDGR